MGISGGGSNILKSHTHDGTIAQDGGSLNMDNVTQGALTAGDIVYSDGSHLQRLAIGAVNTTLSSTGAVPQWAAAGGAAYEFLGSDRVTTPRSSLSVSFTAEPGDTIGNIIVCWSYLAMNPSPAYAKFRISFNGITTGGFYKSQWCEMDAGGTFTYDANQYIEMPTGRRQCQGTLNAFCGTPQQTATPADTTFGATGSYHSESPGFTGAYFTCSGDVGGLPNTFDQFTSVTLEMDSGNIQTGGQLSVFANKIS